MIHSNSHPDKEHRMDGIIKHFIEGDMHALDNYPTGSEPGTWVLQHQQPTVVITY